jgi:uncharacterized membrane protein YheB (UPF0754 family)
MEKINNFINEKLKVNSKTIVNHKPMLTVNQKKELERWAFLELEPWAPKNLDREYFEDFVKRILNNHSSSIDSYLYDRLHDYLDRHEEDEHIEKCLKNVTPL